MKRTLANYREILAALVKNGWRLKLQGYTPGERLQLALARTARRSPASFLGLQVNFLSAEAFRYLVHEVFFQGCYFFHADTPAPVILDCGANIGMAVLYLKRLYPQATITAFEADPATAAVLRSNIEQNRLSGVTVHNVMLSDQPGEQPFYIAPEGEGSLQMSGRPDRIAGARKLMLRAERLSTYITGPIDLLKLDVEGFEFQVLTDLQQSGKLALVQRLFIEYHHGIHGEPPRLAAFLAILESAGFHYQLNVESFPMMRRGAFYDILIAAYR